MIEYFKSTRIIDGKPRKVIVAENGHVINRNPTKEELEGLKNEPRTPQDTRNVIYYTNEELLKFLRQFYKENERPPTWQDFSNNPAYPHYSTYWRIFRSWQKALKLVSLDTESMVKKGFLKNSDQKARLAEIIIRKPSREIQ